MRRSVKRPAVTTPRLQRLLPDSWQGDSREARWRRSRGRRVLTGLLAAVAVLAVAGAVRPADPPTHAVTVAAHDMAAGARLSPSDLRQVRWAAEDRVPGALAAAAASGKILTTPIVAGEPITSARVRGARSWPSVPKKAVVIGVTSSDRALVRVLQPGDRVDLIDTGKARTIASSVRVVSVQHPTEQSDTGTPSLPSASASSSNGPGVLVAVPPAEAAAVGAAAATRGGLDGGIQLALRMPGESAQG
ncbi:SAF domain-containing protein [Flexivirga sp. B27]